MCIFFHFYRITVNIDPMVRWKLLDVNVFMQYSTKDDHTVTVGMFRSLLLILKGYLDFTMTMVFSKVNHYYVYWFSFFSLSPDVRCPLFVKLHSQAVILNVWTKLITIIWLCLNIFYHYVIFHPNHTIVI